MWGPALRRSRATWSRTSIVAIALGALATAAACGDLFHDTEWSNCEGDGCGSADAPASGSATSGGVGGEGGTSGVGAGGTGNDGGNGGAPPTYESACMALATAYCQRLDACYKPLFIDLGGPGCAAAFASACAESWSAEDVNATPAQAMACVEATNIGQATCSDVVRYASGQLQAPECFIPGQRGDGSVCFGDPQCSGGECLPGGGQQQPVPPGCGVCATVAAASMPCDGTTGCQAGLRCAGGLCTKLSDIGEACGNNAHCFADLRCAGNDKCVARIAEGESCQASSGDDGCVQTSVCASGVCGDWVVAAEGATCGKGFIAAPTLCEPGLFCQGGVLGECVKAGMVGAACPTAAPVNGVSCVYPAQCFAQTCVEPQAETCE